MGEVNIKVGGRNYGISCQDGQEQRVHDLGIYVEQRLNSIAQAGAATNENHLLVLTALMLSDEVFDLKDNIGATSQQLESAKANQNHEEEVAGAINQLAERIDQIAKRIQAA
ncbi:MAG: cell division protein ZapA [Alphaproteobacteria bacterium]|nr:cell division protein ZapA [Alphaproteobacteria bacterium]